MTYVWQLDGIWPPISWSLAAKMDCGCKWKVVWLSSHLWLGWSYCFIRWPQHLRRSETNMSCFCSFGLQPWKGITDGQRAKRYVFCNKGKGDKVGDCGKPVFLSFSFSPLTFSIKQSEGNRKCHLSVSYPFFSILEKLPEKLSTSHVFASSSACQMLLPFWNTPQPWVSSSEVMP